jgi:hypothetical protein
MLRAVHSFMLQSGRKNSRVPVATQEAVIRRIRVGSQRGQIVSQDPILKSPSQK